MGKFDDEFGQPKERSADDLRKIVRSQRALIAVVLAQLTLWGGYCVLYRLGSGSSEPRAAMMLTIVLGGIGGVYAFLISWELRGGFAAIVFGLATIIPVLGLLVLLMVHTDASSELKKHGIAVGMFGASLSSIEDRQSLYDDDENAGW